jgi:serine protease Do
MNFLPAAAFVLGALLLALPQDQEQALALEKAVAKAIERNAPCIAGIFVSRSELYGLFGQGATDEHPGQLGGLDREALKKHPRFVELNVADQKSVLKRLDLANPTMMPEGLGCGAVLDSAGLVLTPFHVVQGAVKIYVHLADGAGSYADIHAADPRSDLAVLRLLRPPPPTKLQAIQLGDGGKVERGQFVIGLAWAFDPSARPNQPSAAWGVVANVQQRVPAGEITEGKSKTLYRYGKMLLTDARVNLGVSGGVLLNLQGEAVALTSNLAGPSGPDAIGSMALPLDASLRRIIGILKKGEEVEYGFLGVGSEETPGKADGAKLNAVREGSPADLAGLKEGQVVLGVDGRPVHDAADLWRELSTMLAGSSVQLEVRKPGTAARQKVTVLLARYHVRGTVIATSTGARPFFRGLRVDWTSLLVQQPGANVSDIPRGVLISEVQPDSPAAQANLKPGAVVTKVNDRPVTTPAAFYEIVRNHKGPVQLTLQAAENNQPPPKVILP